MATVVPCGHLKTPKRDLTANFEDSIYSILFYF